MKYLVMDTETGGIVKGTSLLTSYFGVLNSDFQLIDELEMFIRPEDRIYQVTAEALNVNKINLIEHDQRARTYREAGNALYDFLCKTSNDGAIKLAPLGHNVYFDIDKIHEFLMTKNTWLKFVSYRMRDTGVVGNFLKDKGLIPEEISGSLGSYCKFFGIDTSKAHDARGDCMMVVDLFKAMKKL